MQYFMQQIIPGQMLNKQTLYQNGTTDMEIQWNLSVTTTFMIKFITCDLFSNVF